MTEWSIIWEARGAFLNGALNTLILFILSVLAAFAIGCFTVYLLEARNALSTVLRWAINLMRMLPFLVLAYLLYYGLPSLGVKPSAWGAGLVALAIYHAAYFAEILRGARIVLPAGQIEAAKAHGFRAARLYWRIILPQLVIRTRPLLGNQLIYALKDTAFLTIITVQELTAAANSVQATYFIPTEAFIVVIALYWVISICLELALKWAGRFGAKRGFEHA
ncbi:MAG: amino acid ABC transporter permease [Gammaproteobacteria bacterium]|nr:amino acid ABC transporter permease [Gammaproteobacteria bacterium]MBU1489728.1 amino acid ABC transporter permease [Gammaproteobacteria bacterium]MBU2065078.1 amino acid ABC transporter permease [Gammaproteobacteria bacterium]MBU2137582.1 amino acid ABC transporter permease [Gammaproteobacteria bacterium]MBU2216462.1 amino acid ABC transporter permease [Gammaproteobacteria bacterium]